MAIRATKQAKTRAESRKAAAERRRVRDSFERWQRAERYGCRFKIVFTDRAFDQLAAAGGEVVGSQGLPEGGAA